MIIYFILNKLNGKYYIGQTRKSLQARWSEHASLAKAGSKTYFAKAIRKYGKNNFEPHPTTNLRTTMTSGKTFLALIGGLTLLVLSPIVYSFIQVNMWDWFVVPYLHLPHIGKAVIYGLNLLIGTFLIGRPVPKETRNEMLGPPLAMLMLWGIAAIVHYWIL